VYEADRALVKRMRAGEQGAFDEFFKASAPRLIKTARQPAHLSLDELDSMLHVEEPLRAPQNQEPISQLDAATRRTEVMKILQSLPPHYALALEAKYGDGMSVEAIARQLGLSGIATQSVLARARDAFRQRWLETSADARYGESAI
jgi:DNA-directed RNA polymerase specialized sigma24 family protein